MSLILALLLAAQTAPAKPPVPVAAPEASSAAPLSQQTATELLGVVLPLDPAIAEQRRAHREALAERVATDDDLRTLAEQKPAFRPALERAVDEEVDATYRRLAPELQGEVLAIYRRTLSEAEGRELVTWFGSPTGQKLVAAMYRGTADSASSSASGIGNDGRRAALSALGPEDRPMLERLASRPELTAKMRQVAPVIGAASNKFIERCTAALSTALPALIDSVSARFAKAS